MENDKILPIGTIINVSEKDIPLIIAGYAAESPEGVLYDYVCFLYPIGIEKSMKAAFVNKKQVKKIIHMGYKNDMFESFKEVVKEIMEKGGKKE